MSSSLQEIKWEWTLPDCIEMHLHLDVERYIEYQKNKEQKKKVDRAKEASP